MQLVGMYAARICFEVVGILALAASSRVVHITMATTLAELYLSNFVFTPVNLSAFLKWAKTATEEELDQAFEVVYMVDHRMEETCFGHIPHLPVVLFREDLNRRFIMPTRECDDEGCRRCELGRCGYQFRWVGPWTCSNTIGDENTPANIVYQRIIGCHCGLH